MTDTTERPPLPAPPSDARPSGPDDAAPTGEWTPVRFAWLRLSALVTVLVLLGIWSPWVLVLIGAIAGMITLHELGHYLTAKRAGMKVTEFFLFFGPRVWSFRRGETEYGIKCIPAGAYVKIIGMHNLEDVPPEDEARTYRQKSFGQRVSVAVAGSTMHFLLAFGLIWVALALVGQPGGTLNPRSAENWQISSVVPGSGADEAGLEPGDQVLSFDGRSVEKWTDLRTVAEDFEGKTVTAVYRRDGKERTTDLTLRPFTSWVVDRIVPGTGPAAAGLEPFDSILAIDGARTSYLGAGEVNAKLEALEGKTVPVLYERDDVRRTVDVEISSLRLRGAEGFVGVGRDRVAAEKLGAVQALAHTPGEFVDITRLSFQGLTRFFTPSGISGFASQVGSARSDSQKIEEAQAGSRPPSGDASSATVYDRASASDPGETRILSVVGLVQIGSDLGQVDPGALIGLFALINIFIGVFNLVPLLPFDGGHVAIAVYERIQERRLGRRRYFTDVSRLLPLTNVVVIALGLLFLSSLYLDVMNPIQT